MKFDENSQNGNAWELNPRNPIMWSEKNICKLKQDPPIATYFISIEIGEEGELKNERLREAAADADKKLIKEAIIED